ncbi:MAG: isoleucine--tRNA ligase [ANME-2 cluster archaeon]|nr:isoleucine--tRNA ligase [ANME-2 cluster archaeon]
MIREITNKYEPKTLEEDIRNFWDSINAYPRSRQLRAGSTDFYFVDGPPYTTGHIHLGTAWNKIIKDSILRYKSMKNFCVRDRAGWDMHGLPIEVKVEEALGFTSKKDIEEYGVDQFIAKCKEFAIQHKDEMTQQFKDLGVWLDWEDPYMTLKDEYIEAAWWTLKRGNEKGLLERGKRVVNWCPRCETAIADSEVEYWDEEDPSVYIKFKVNGEDNTYIVIWTTTPWTIPANIAVAVHPSFEYSKIRAWKGNKEDSEVLYMATELVENVLKQGRYSDYEILDRMLGEDMLRLSYENPLSDKIPAQAGFEHNVYMADFVTAENTGCVHVAPGHGLDDFILGVEYNMPIFCPVGPDGRYTEDAGEYEGKYVKEADELVLDDLDERGNLLHKDIITHRYGHCWRCKTPIIYLATEQWFLKISDIKDEMLNEIKKVEWHPDWAGSARFADWISGARDWCISRQRYWGIPLPIWICADCGELEVIGTMEELRERSGLKGHIDLHRPNVDTINITCRCSGTMKREPDVFDVWFDSAVASWATLHYPAEHEDFDKLWPADFITEGHDQTRGWFYSQLGASMLAFGKAPYKSVLMHGFTLDDTGKKMSKSLGNVVSPEEVASKLGADTLRLYVLSSNAPWEDLKFNWEEVSTVNRMMNIFWNVYRFPLPYMALDNFDPATVSYEMVKPDLRPEDRWILSRVNSLAVEVEKAMEQYDLHRATRPISDFILEDLSRWYIQLIRPRTWLEENEPDKVAAYWVIYEVLVKVAKIISPFTPHLAESIYQNLVRNLDSDSPESIHMCDWPTAQHELIDTELEGQMDTIRKVVEAVSNARQKVKRKLRWPVSRIVVAPESEAATFSVHALRSVLLEQTNSKDVILLGEGETWDELGGEIVPQSKTIGPAFKGDAGKVIAALGSIDVSALQVALSTSQEYELEIQGKTAIITPDMVQFKETIPEYIATAEFTGGMVYIDARLTREIESEGYAREVIRRVQDMRKELDLDVEARIRAVVRIEDERICDLVLDWEAHIAGEVRSKLLIIGIDVEPEGDLVKEWDVEGTFMKMSISESA